MTRCVLLNEGYKLRSYHINKKLINELQLNSQGKFLFYNFIYNIYFILFYIDLYINIIKSGLPE